MKKGLSIVAALASVVTIGGVYATWTYANNAASSAYSTLSTSLTNADFEGKVGSISVVGDGARIVFDDTDKDFVAEMVVFAKDNTVATQIQFTISFTGNAGADNTNLQISYEVKLEGFEYNGVEFLKLKAPITGTCGTAGTTVTIDVANDLVFTEFSLPTHTEYKVMEDILKNATFTVEATDTTTRS